MTRSEYQELVEFIGPKFDEIWRRFNGVDARFDAVDGRFDARFDRTETRLTSPYLTRPPPPTGLPPPPHSPHLTRLADRYVAADLQKDPSHEPETHFRVLT